jgi:DNA-binding MarR family transcriptional regulator
LQPCTSKQLAEWQGVSVPAMSRMVACLVRRKLLVRKPDAYDGRCVQLQLSTKGKQEFKLLRRSLETELASHIAALESGKKNSLAESLTVLEELFGEK